MRSGGVEVNGTVVLEPATRVRVVADFVSIGGESVRLAPPKASSFVYFALNKPKGFVCADPGDRRASDRGSGQEGPRAVLSLFDDWKQERAARAAQAGKSPQPIRLFTVGRLDVKTSGLLFVTTDGDWANRLLHPSSGHVREYAVSLKTPPTTSQLRMVSAGVRLGEDAHMRPLRVERVRDSPGLRIWVGEGRYHEVRMLAEQAGLEVKNLRRVAFGSFRLPRTLAPGSFLRLSRTQALRLLGRGEGDAATRGPAGGGLPRGDDAS